MEDSPKTAINLGVVGTGTLSIREVEVAQGLRVFGCITNHMPLHSQTCLYITPKAYLHPEGETRGVQLQGNLSRHVQAESPETAPNSPEMGYLISKHLLPLFHSHG